MDISALTLSELNQLQKDVSITLVERSKQDLSAAQEQVKAIAQALGMSVKDLVESMSKIKSTTGVVKTVAAKYRNPANSDEKWTGRGRKPRWIVAALAAGATLESLAI